MSVKSSKNTIAGTQFRAFLMGWADKSGKKKNELAAELGLSPSNFGDYLHGVKSPSLALMEEIAEKIGVDLADMLLEGKAILAGGVAPSEVAHENKIVPAAQDKSDYLSPVKADLSDIKGLLAEHLLLAQDGRFENKQRIEEFIEHIDTLKKGIDDREERITALFKSKQEEINRLSAAHNQVIDQLQAQIDFYKGDNERLKGQYESQKKTLETDMAELVRNVHLLAGVDVRTPNNH